MEDGDLLESSASGRRILVKAAKEDLFLARAESWEELSRAAYHFGNRHAALELGDLFLKFPPDPVLEEMARRLGLKLERVEEPFRPERASYHSHGGD
jgi:urease accessory protein